MRQTLLLSLLVGALGCSDSSRGAFTEGRARYESLVAQGTMPTDPAFDSVLATLRKVPPESREHAQAQVLISAIERARGPLAPRPLPRDAGASHSNHAH